VECSKGQARGINVASEVKSMDIKKTQQITSATETPVTKRKVQDFVADLKSEIHKIHWTSRDELLVYAQIVVWMTLVMGLGIYILDLFIQGSLNTLNFLIRLIGG
jgi:preprotein translocase subunit SecE